MTQYILRRCGWAVVVLYVLVTGVFFVMNGLGDPARVRLGTRASAAQVAAFRQKCGLDKPLGERYVTFIGQLARADLGRTCPEGRPISEIIATRLPRTMLLGFLSLLIEVVVGVGIGIVAAARRDTWLDTGLMSLAFVGISAPTFLTGLLFLNYISFRLGWFPVGGYGVDFLDHVKHAVLPAVTLAILGAATYARVMRSEMIETLRSDYMRTARAKGVAPWRAVLKHGARNALLPIVTILGLSASSLVSGAIITESIYAWPGMGRLAFESITTLDLPTVMGVVVVSAIGVQLFNLLADIAVAVLDPRVRL